MAELADELMLVAGGKAHGGEDVARDHAALEVDDGGLHLVAHAHQAFFVRPAKKSVRRGCPEVKKICVQGVQEVSDFFSLARRPKTLLHTVARESLKHPLYQIGPSHIAWCEL